MRICSILRVMADRRCCLWGCGADGCIGASSLASDWPESMVPVLLEIGAVDLLTVCSDWLESTEDDSVRVRETQGNGGGCAPRLGSRPGNEEGQQTGRFRGLSRSQATLRAPHGYEESALGPWCLARHVVRKGTQPRAGKRGSPGQRQRTFISTVSLWQSLGSASAPASVDNNKSAKVADEGVCLGFSVSVSTLDLTRSLLPPRLTWARRQSCAGITSPTTLSVPLRTTPTLRTQQAARRRHNELHALPAAPAARLLAAPLGVPEPAGRPNVAPAAAEAPVSVPGSSAQRSAAASVPSTAVPLSPGHGTVSSSPAVSSSGAASLPSAVSLPAVFLPTASLPATGPLSAASPTTQPCPPSSLPAGSPNSRISWALREPRRLRRRTRCPSGVRPAADAGGLRRRAPCRVCHEEKGARGRRGAAEARAAERGREKGAPCSG